MLAQSYFPVSNHFFERDLQLIVHIFVTVFGKNRIKYGLVTLL